MKFLAAAMAMGLDDVSLYQVAGFPCSAVARGEGCYRWMCLKWHEPFSLTLAMAFSETIKPWCQYFSGQNPLSSVVA